MTIAERMALINGLVDKFPLGQYFRIEHDGYAGKVCGWYVRDDGAPGVCLQLDDAKVVHVYGTKWLAHLKQS